MANFPEPVSPGFVPVHEWGTQEPVLGGPGGNMTIPIKQLVERDAYLKTAHDTLQGQVDNMAAAVDEESQNAQTLGVLAALDLGAINKQEIDHIKKRVLAQGAVTLKNKWVISGMVLTASDIRALHLSLTGTYTPGNKSQVFIDGILVKIPDNDYAVTVDTNPGGTAITRFAFLIKNGLNYEVQVAAVVPAGGLLLFELTIPAGDVAGNLGAVTIIDRRTIQAFNGWTITTLQETIVPLPFPAKNAPDYQVAVQVEGASHFLGLGPIEVYNRQQNSFTIRHRGTADNVPIRWTLLNPNG